MPTEKKTAEAVLAGQRIRSVCRVLGISQKELADRSGIGNSRLGNYIQGSRELPIREAKRIEQATGVPAAYLLGVVDEDDMELLRAPRAARQAALQMIRSLGGAPPPQPTEPGAPFIPTKDHPLRRRA